MMYGSRAILLFMATCSSIYHACTPVLVRLTPLTVDLKKKRFAKNKSIGVRDLEDMDGCTLHQVRFLNLCGFTYDFSKCRIPAFKTVVSLTVESVTFDIFHELPEFSHTLKSFTFIYKRRRRPLRNDSEHDALIQLLKNPDTYLPPLRCFRISCPKPTINGPFRASISRSGLMPSTVQDFHEHFESRLHKKWQKFARFINRDLLHLGEVLNVLLRRLRYTLMLAEFENFDFSFVMVHSPSLTFRNTLVIITDNASIVHLYSWVYRIRSKSLTLLVDDKVGSIIHHISFDTTLLNHTLKSPKGLGQWRTSMYSSVLHS